MFALTGGAVRGGVLGGGEWRKADAVPTQKSYMEGKAPAFF